jgi:PiT family inorganic phosphate transporter
MTETLLVKTHKWGHRWSIMGVGSTNSFSTVKWGVAENILWAWILTIPAAGGMAALCVYAFKAFGVQ